MESGGDSIEDEMNTESALDEFTQDPSELMTGVGVGVGVGGAEEKRQDEFSEQVKKYTENKPRKKKPIDREWNPTSLPNVRFSQSKSPPPPL